MSDNACPKADKDHAADLCWFAMSAPYCKEMEAKRYLEQNGIECFVPMRWQICIDRNGCKKRKLVPAIHNLIFVRTTRPILQQLKSGVRFLQYRTRPENGKNVPILVPNDQMHQFITLSDTFDSNILFFRPEELNLSKGTRVRVHGGVFDGLEGFFIKVAGKRNRRVVVAIDDLIAVTVEISPDLIEVLA